MNKEEAVRFAGLMEDYLNIPSFVCEMIQQQLEENKYKEVVEYVIQRRNEIENKEDYIGEQEAIHMWISKLEGKDKEIDRLKGSLDTAIEDIFTLLRVIDNNVKELKCSAEELKVINKYSYNQRRVKND